MSKKVSGRLTEDGVREVRERRAKGETYQSIASAMGVSVGTIYNIVKRKTWSQLK
jgi:DNA invertase Pin-like site-specific DNA recombinase